MGRLMLPMVPTSLTPYIMSLSLTQLISPVPSCLQPHTPLVPLLVNWLRTWGAYSFFIFTLQLLIIIKIVILISPLVSIINGVHIPQLFNVYDWRRHKVRVTLSRSLSLTLLLLLPLSCHSLPFPGAS